MVIDFAKEARDLQVAVSANAYPAADGSADIDNNSRPIIEVTLREIARQANEPLRIALASARAALIGAGFVGRGPHGSGDPEINAIDDALSDT